MRLDLLSYIKQLMLPTWRQPENIGLAQVLFGPIQSILTGVENYEREALYRAGLTGQKLILQHYLQEAVNGEIQIKDQDGLRWDFAVIVPETLSADARRQVRDIVDRYKLASKRYEIRDAFAIAGGGVTQIDWASGYPKYQDGKVAWAINSAGGYLTRIKRKDTTTYLVNEVLTYQVGVPYVLETSPGDFDIEVGGLYYQLYVAGVQYSFGISTVAPIEGDVNGGWRINLAENVRGVRDFSIEWFKGASTTPISIFTVDNLNTNTVQYLYFNPRSEEPWRIKSNGAGTYRVVVKHILNGIAYFDQKTVNFTNADLGVVDPGTAYSMSIASVQRIAGDANGAWKINLTESVRAVRTFTIEWYKGSSTTPISTLVVENLDTNTVQYLYFNPKSEEPWHIKSNGPGIYRVKVKVTVAAVEYTDDENVTFSTNDLGIVNGGISSNVIDKSLLATDWGGEYGDDEVLYSDGSHHNKYWFTSPQSAIPTGLTVADFPKVRGMVAYWKGKEGTSISMPAYWDRCNPAPGVYIFTPLIWAVQHAAANGMKVNFFLKANRRWTADPAYNTCSTWSFDKADAEVDETGLLHGEPWNHMPALGSTKWGNWYTFVEKFAEALSPYVQHIGWIAGACNGTKEWGTMYNENSTYNPATIAVYKNWHNLSFGSIPSDIAKRSDANSANKRRTGKFHSWILNEIWAEASRRIKAVNPAFRTVYHMSSATNETFRRTNLTVLAIIPDFMDGMKNNPARAYNKGMAIRAIARPNKMAIVEWTNDEGITATEMIDNFTVAIDYGASGLSFSFFENAWKEIGGQADLLLSDVVTGLKANGRWSKTYNYNNTNPNTIEMSATTAMGNNAGDYEAQYLSAFNASAAANGGALPSLKYIDDIGGTDTPPPTTGTPKVVSTAGIKLQQNTDGTWSIVDTPMSVSMSRTKRYAYDNSGVGAFDQGTENSTWIGYVFVNDVPLKNGNNRKDFVNMVITEKVTHVRVIWLEQGFYSSWSQLKDYFWKIREPRVNPVALRDPVTNEITGWRNDGEGYSQYHPWKFWKQAVAVITL